MKCYPEFTMSFETNSFNRMPFALIVEDDRDIVALFQQVLDIAGYRTEIVLDGIEAMERISTSLPDIVLLDLQLPGMSGVEILKRMRENESMMNIPVVVITAYAHLPQNLTVEPDLLLKKPVNINQLGRLVQKLKATQGGLNRPRLDPVSGLHDMSFFLVRLTFSLERIKQTMVRRFGVLFADIPQLQQIRHPLTDAEREHFQRRLAGQFREALRPTDTVTWSEDEQYFLTLIEDVPSDDVALKVARRVGDEMRKHSGPYNMGLTLRVNMGVLICDGEYDDTHQIIRDVNFARDLMRDKQHSNPVVFDREMLHERGISSRE
jgi:CheY-like chemotaxis protein